jgi:hypothetical protein
VPLACWLRRWTTTTGYCGVIETDPNAPVSAALASWLACAFPQLLPPRIKPRCCCPLQYQVYLGGDNLPDSLYAYPGNYLVSDNATASLNSMMNYAMFACTTSRAFWCEMPVDAFPCYPVPHPSSAETLAAAALKSALHTAARCGCAQICSHITHSPPGAPRPSCWWVREMANCSAPPGRLPSQPPSPPPPPPNPPSPPSPPLPPICEWDRRMHKRRICRRVQLRRLPACCPVMASHGQRLVVASTDCGRPHAAYSLQQPVPLQPLRLVPGAQPLPNTPFYPQLGSPPPHPTPTPPHPAPVLLGTARGHPRTSPALTAGAPIVANAKYVTCDGNGTWCYQHGGESNTKSFTNSRLACQALNGDLVWWWVAALVPSCTWRRGHDEARSARAYDASGGWSQGSAALHPPP